jgi:hypothetical protein
MKKILLLWLMAVNQAFASPPSISDQTFSLNENAAQSTLVGTVLATGSGLKFKLTEGNLGDAFSLDSLDGKIRVLTSQAIDYEFTKLFKLKVKVSNSDGIDSAIITVNLINLNDNSPQIFDSLRVEVKENTPKNELVHQVFAFDPDGDLNALQYSILSPKPDLDLDSLPSVSIDPYNGKILINDADEFDFERFKFVDARIRVTDGTFSDTATYVFEILNVNDNSPVLFSDTIRVAENPSPGKLIHTLKATDLDFPLDTLYFGMLENADPNQNLIAAVKLDVQSGQLTVGDSTDFDYELVKTFRLKIWVSDTLFADTAQFVVVLEDLNDTRPIFLAETLSIHENLPKDSLLTTLKITDPDTQNQFSYTIVSGNLSDAFYIDSFGNLRVNNSLALDYEALSGFDLIINVSDGVFLVSNTIKINLINLNDNAPVLADQSFLIEENYPQNLLVGVISAFDADFDSLSFKVLSGNVGDAFRLEPASSTSSIRLISNQVASLDFEKNPVFELQVEVSDGHFRDTAKITIRLINLNDEPIAIFDTTFFVVENGRNLVLGTVRISDLDQLGLPVFSFVDAQYQDSLSVGALGEIRARYASMIDFERQERFSFQVQVFDGIFYDTALVQVVVLDSNDPPTGIVLSDTVLYDRTPARSVVATLKVIDQDRNDSHRFALVMDTTTDERLFFIRNTNELVINTSIDINLKREYSFELMTTDLAGATFRQKFRLKVDLANSLDSELMGATLYPNPSRGHVYLSLQNELMGEISWEIYDLQGRRLQGNVFPKQSFHALQTLDLNALVSGVYFLKISLQNRSTFFKFKVE